MNEDNNERLAELYQAGVKQMIIIFPILWAHSESGDWFILKIEGKMK